MSPCADSHRGYAFWTGIFRVTKPLMTNYGYSKEKYMIGR